MTGKVLSAMISYFGTDIHRISHALKAYGYAKTIAGCEGLTGDNLSIVECSSILHDIGIPESIKKYGSSDGKYQQEMGVIVGKNILEEISFPEGLREKVLFIIGNHHSYDVDGGILLQIMFEADFIVNLEEGYFEDTPPVEIKNKYFKTATGKKLMDIIFGLK